MKHRLLTLMVAGLFAAGTACAQSSKDQLIEKKQQPTLSASPAGTAQPAKADRTSATQLKASSPAALAPSAKQMNTAQQKEEKSDGNGQRTGVDRVTANQKKMEGTAPTRSTVAPAAPAAAPKTTVAATPAFSPEYTPEVAQRMYDLELKMKTDPTHADQYRAEYEQLREQRKPTKAKK